MSVPKAQNSRRFDRVRRVKLSANIDCGHTQGQLGQPELATDHWLSRHGSGALGTDISVALCLPSEGVDDVHAHGAWLLIKRHLLPLAAGKGIGQWSRVCEVGNPHAGVPALRRILDPDPSTQRMAAPESRRIS